MGVTGGPVHLADGFSGAGFAARHQVRVHAEGEPRVAVAELEAQRLDVLAGVQKDRGVEVPQGVHAVFTSCRVSLPLLRHRDDARKGKRGLPPLVVEAVAP